MSITLTEAAIKARRSIRYGVYFIIFILIARSVLSFSINTYKRLVPKAPPPPTLGFNILPAIDFPKQNVEIPALDFKVETPTGSLPSLPPSMAVYAMPKYFTSLDSVEQATKKARSLGFSSDPEEISSTEYRFKHTTVFSTLDINIATGAFSTSFNLASDPSILDSNPPTVDGATGIAKNVLASTSDAKDLTGPVASEYLKVESSSLVTVPSLSEAELVKVNFFRKSFGEKGEYPSLTSNPKEANVWFIISGASQREKQVIASEYHYYKVSEDLVETYPVRTPTQALEDLKNNKGYIASLGTNTDGKIVIRRIYLAYFDPEVPGQFFQPVIVFDGDRDFRAYVPAVTEDYYGK